MSTIRPSTSLRVAALIVLGLAACSSEPLTGPPEVKLGRSECAACGMIISEDRCSSALLIEHDGRREYRLFDDIGCMLDDERESGEGRRSIERYVHDHDTRGWIEASRAVYLFTEHDAIATPMGSGIVAYATSESAERSKAAHPGVVHDLDSLAAARRAWMEKHHGKPK